MERNNRDGSEAKTVPAAAAKSAAMYKGRYFRNMEPL
jgi:hypothetical protein